MAIVEVHVDDQGSPCAVFQFLECAKIIQIVGPFLTITAIHSKLT